MTPATLTPKQHTLLAQLTADRWSDVKRSEYRTALSLHQRGLVDVAGPGPGAISEARLTEDGERVVLAFREAHGPTRE